MEFKKLVFLLLLIIFTFVSCSSGEMGFFEKIWQQNKVVVIIAVILIILILVVLKIFLFPSAAAEEPALAPEKEPETAAPPEDKTKAAEEEATVMEGEIAGSLTVIVKDEEIGTFDITPTHIIVGRDPRSDVVVKSETISKSHLKIIPKGDQFFLVDLGSTNGTYVNGEKITETLVTPDDMVQLGKRGNVKLIFKKTEILSR